MTTRWLLNDPGALKELAERLSRCREVTKHDRGSEPEAWTLAHTFHDLEESFRKFLDDLLPELLSPNVSESETYELLLDIGEELRHILYHIKDPQFFRYLVNVADQVDDETSGSGP